MDVSRIAPRDVSFSSLVSLSLRGLQQMTSQVGPGFCHRVVKTSQGLERQGTSLRYTLITLLGLTECEKAGVPSEFPTEELFASVLPHLERLDDLGDLALLCWLCARRDPGRLRSVLPALDLPRRVLSLPAFRHQNTMELSWLLAALSHIQLAGAGGAHGLSALAHQAFRLLLRNQAPSGLFGHAGPSASLLGSLRSRVGSFADQIYPIYALARYVQAWQLHGALTCATRCADTLLEQQGPLGQWWWHYDALRGRAVGRYPVYSVHQDGMAPMALFALGNAVNNRTPYTAAACKGLSWIYGHNELAQDMRDLETGLIWRCLQQQDMLRYSSELIQMLGVSFNGPHRLRLLHECRPYHPGWLLYAFCPEHLGHSSSITDDFYLQESAVHPH